MRSVIRGAAAVVLLLSTWHCNKSATAPADLGFVQTVRIEPDVLRRGEPIAIRSEVTNAGLRPRWGTFRICRFGLAGDLKLSEIPGTARCASVSYEREIAPGETVLGGDRMVVDSPSGTYVLEVRHLISPDIVQRITVHVAE